MELSNNEVHLVVRDKIEYLEFTAFDKYHDDMTAVFAIRGHLNMDYNWPRTDVNYDELASTIGVDSNKVMRITEQVHGDLCLRVDNTDIIPDKVDALMTNVPGITLVTRMADCIAVLAYDPINRAIANIHSGWRGTIQKIAPKTVEKMMKEYGTNPKDLIIVLCPSIGKDHFEVMNDVKTLFAESFGDDHIEDCGDGHFLIDAPLYLADSLVAVGVARENIHFSNICTVCHNDLVHSFRGNIESEKQFRNAALICLK